MTTFATEKLDEVGVYVELRAELLAVKGFLEQLGRASGGNEALSRVGTHLNCLDAVCGHVVAEVDLGRREAFAGDLYACVQRSLALR